MYISRGALIKPWIFKEIKEETHWDISSTERFEILKNFTNYGLEHWGSDTEVSVTFLKNNLDTVYLNMMQLEYIFSFKR